MELRTLAIEDVSFVNLRGEEISRSNLVEEVIKFYELKIQEGETRVTDFNEGSEIRNLIESFVVDIYHLMEMETDILRNCFIDTATGNWLDKIGLHPFVQLPRETGSASIGSVTFTLPSALTSEVIIPSNTILVGDNDLYYATDSDCVISIGDLSNTVNITCSTVGRDGNTESNTITTIDDSFINEYLVTVTNPNPTVNGVDYEDDEVYRERLLNYVRRDDFGSIGYYKDLAEKVDGVHDVVFLDDETYTKKILVNGNTKPTPDTILLDVLAVFSNLDNTVINHRFTVDKPVFDSFDLDVTINTNRELSETTLTNFLLDYFNGGSHIEGLTFKGLNISQGVTESELSNIFSIFEDIQSATFEIDGTTVTEIPCVENHTLVLDSVTITQNVL